MAKILIVDDEKAIRSTLRDILELEGYEVEEAENGVDAVAKVQQNAKFNLVLSDIKMPQMDGVEVLERIKILRPDLPVVMISGHGNIDTAVEAVKKGAFDYISKPPDMNKLLITVRNALDKSNLTSEVKKLRRTSNSKVAIKIVGESASIAQIHGIIDRIAPTESRVLITGPNGSGKELVARLIHERSGRHDGPMVEVNCAAIPSELIEAELFGHVKGAFTGAIRDNAGKFEQANGGTIFLDEIGDMSLSAQAKVLRALQEKKITRVGGDREIEVDVRVVAATNKNLREMINKGLFREDLYHRLAVMVIQVPSLNERREDIPLLVDHFIQLVAQEQSSTAKTVSQNAMNLLRELNWTGNIRELRNVVERLMIMSQGNEISEEDVKANVIPTAAANHPQYKDAITKMESMDDFLRIMQELAQLTRNQPVG